MAIVASTTTVGTSAVVVATGDADGSAVILHNDSISKLYLGGATVNTTAGFPIAGGSTFSMDLAPGQPLYGIAATAGHTIRALVMDR